jgi:uncharacterized protein (TIRG00374 family)
LLKFLAKLVVSAGLLAVLVILADTGALRSALVRADWRDVLAATLVLVAHTPFLARRWRDIAQAIGIRLTWGAALRIVVIGTFFNQVLPSAIGGDAARVWLLRNENVPVTRGLCSILLDRIVGLLGMAAVVVVGFPWLLQIVRQPVPRSAAAAAVVVGLAGMVLLLSLDRLPLPKIVRSRSFIRRLLSVADDARAVVLAPRVISSALAASVVVHLMVSTAAWILAKGIGLDVGIEVFVLLLPLVLLLTLLPISIAGWGVREGTMIACLSLVGVDASSAFAVSVLLGLTYVLAALPGGLVWLLSGGTTRASGPSS